MVGVGGGKECTSIPCTFIQLDKGLMVWFVHTTAQLSKCIIYNLGSFVHFPNCLKFIVLGCLLLLRFYGQTIRALGSDFTS